MPDQVVQVVVAMEALKKIMELVMELLEVKIPVVEAVVEKKNLILEEMVVLVYVSLPGKSISNLRFFFRNKKRTIIIPVFYVYKQLMISKHRE